MGQLHRLTCKHQILNVYHESVVAASSEDADDKIRIPMKEITFAKVLTGETSKLLIHTIHGKHEFELLNDDSKLALAQNVAATINKRSKQTPKERRVLIFALSFLALCIIAAFGFWPSSTSSGSNSGKITLEVFNAIEAGMSYEQVCQMIGGEGELLSEVDLGAGDEFVTRIYSWDGRGSLGANANITFQGNKVSMKAQFGLS